MDGTIVWMVPLRQGSTEEQRGVLTLEAPHLVFTDRREGSRLEIPLADIRKARRVRGSPIMVLTLDEGPGRCDLAFYFAQPPPLKSQQKASDRPRLLTPFGGVGGDESSGKTTKKVMRTNVSYLSQASASKKPEIQAWLKAIREAGRG